MTAPDAPRPTPEQAREVAARADEVAALLSGLAGAPARFREHVRTAFGSSQQDKVLGELSAIGVERLREVSGERLRVGRLVDGGVTTVGDVLRAGPAGLERLPGIGPQTATHCLAAAAQIAQAVQETLRFRIDDAPGDPFTTGHRIHGLRISAFEAHHDRVRGAVPHCGGGERAVQIAANSVDRRGPARVGERSDKTAGGSQRTDRV